MAHLRLTGGGIYVITGNGTFDADQQGLDYGNAFLRLEQHSDQLYATDFFTPFDQEFLESEDGDLGSGGPLLIPDEAGSETHPHLWISAGKEGVLYLLDRDNNGGYNPFNNDQTVQSWLGLAQGLFANPAYFRKRIYVHGFNDVLKAFSIENGIIDTNAVVAGPVFGFPGASACITANGNTNGIVWEVRADGYLDSGGTPGILLACMMRFLTFAPFMTAR